MSDFWSCPPLWEGETAILLAGGESLRGFDASALIGRKVLAIKEACILAPWAPVMFFADNCWFERERNLVEWFPGEVITVSKASRALPKCKVMRRGPREGICEERHVLAGSWTSVHYALNLLKHLGVARIGVLGVDLVGRRWHDRNPAPPAPENFVKMGAALASTAAPLAAAGIEVVNCSPGGALEIWPRMPLEAFLCAHT